MELGSHGNQIAFISHSLSKIYCGTWESRRSGCFGYRYFLCILFFELEIHEDYHIGALVPREKGVFFRQLICTSNVRDWAVWLCFIIVLARIDFH